LRPRDLYLHGLAAVARSRSAPEVKRNTPKDDGEAWREDVRDPALGDRVHLLIVRLRGFWLAPVQPLLEEAAHLLAGITPRVGSAT